MPQFFSAAILSGLRRRFAREDPNKAQSLTSEKVRILYSNLWQPVYAGILGAVLLVSIMWEVVAPSVLISWLVAIIAISLIRLRLASLFLQSDETSQAQPKWLFSFALTVFVAGCVWGTAGVLMFAPEHPEYVAALAIVLSGVAAGCVTMLSAIWWIVIFFILPIGLPLQWMFVTSDIPTHTMIGIVMMVFLGLLIITSRRMGLVIHDNISLRVSMAAREATIYHQAYYDALTDLPNRRMFIERLETLCAGDQHASGLLLFMDLDRFKLINDTLGHAAGDDLLIQVARRLEGCLHEGDMAARLSGDEFVLLALTNTATAKALDDWAEVYMQGIQHALSDAYRLENHWVDVTPSIGFTCFQAGGCHHDELLKEADLAMYQAKMGGRAQRRRYQPWMLDEAKQLAQPRAPADDSTSQSDR
ncbi:MULTISPECIES: GGDEF domain-containing protein [unclassified Halomonas]|uniref:GGDEF domain-containing protein n=1 Tax=unclassified Halomonas TaxID=2609666 RepID=UPI0006DB139A|nr:MULTISPECIES: GGDEF domain-containing protein [unclassified Halomonas]KPQ30813.1 MAG: GGDEF domain protein [Halomonas sp. HL-93]SBR50429.1 diguanylate cyclase (GGDEF) domain-containing protein [Halomonas sp. HL-93]SNY96847.1 diguanylate cyclase (GGDEF) domain-containing protein [Halomonas sp. hl-4]